MTKISEYEVVTNVSGADRLPISTNLSTVPETKAITVADLLSQVWISDSDTWVYVSTVPTSTFKIVGKDVRSKFPKGTKLKLTQTTVKYFYVINTALSGIDTIVTVTAGSTYTLANATITSPQFSYAATPPGFPMYFNWACTNTGSTALVSGVDFAIFNINGGLAWVAIAISNRTMSGSAGTLGLTLPVASTVSSEFLVNTYIDHASINWKVVRSDVSGAGVYVMTDLGFSTWAANETAVYVRLTGNYPI